MNPIEKELMLLLNEQRENQTHHIPLEHEYRFYRQIAHGDLEVLKYDTSAEPLEGMGVLSKDALRNARYHLIVLIAMISRVCIENGLPTEEAYTLSDLLIRQADLCTNTQGLSEIKGNAIRQFTVTMHNLRKKQVSSLPVLRAMDYIEAHLTEALTASQVAEAVGVSADYLSRLFIAETDENLSRYILSRKCNTACYMLENSQASCTDIAAFLGFASCSHFIERFKQIHGTTPAKYRAMRVRQEFAAN